jgi:putative membrane protein
MTSIVTLAFLHHAAAFLLVAVVTVELVLLRELTLTTARSLLRMDAVYGVAALVLLAVGFLRVFYTEKGSAYYFHSIPFIAKITLFAVVGLLSIYPTRQFLRWRAPLRDNRVPAVDDGTRRKIRLVLHVELTLLFLMMLCAAMMARGIGVFS